MKKISYTKYLAGIIVCLFVFDTNIYSQIILPQAAPLNKDFLLHKKEIEITKEGFALGEIPVTEKPNFEYLKRTGIKYAPKTFGGPLGPPVPPPSDYPTISSSKFDLRDYNYVTEPKNQGACGACWTFAVMGSIESHWKKLGYGTYNLSENNLKNCHGFSSLPCDGGNYMKAMAYLSRFDGPIYDSLDVYSPTIHDCNSDLLPAALVMEARFLVNTSDVLKQALLDHGALYTNMRWVDSCYNSVDKTHYFGGASSNSTNHAVLLVGWDDNKVTAGGTGAWIIKNSWGTSWGESGYFYISYNDTKVNTSVAYFPTKLDYNPEQKQYFYDNFGWVNSYGYVDTIAYGLIKFTAEGNEKIDKVGTWVNSAGANITIDVLDSTSGILSTVSTTCDYPGYYVINLPSSVNITSGNNFYIRVKYITPTYNYPLPTESASGCTPTIQTGKCWISKTAATWTAIGGGTANARNLCIRAYTTPQALVCSVNAGIDKTICNGASASLTATEATSYLWSTGATTSAISVSPTTTTTYRVTGTTGACTATDAIVVTVNAKPSVLVSATSNSICVGQSSNLSASGATSYTWSNGVSGATQTVFPTTTTTYRATGTDANGCTNSAQVIVTVSALPTASAGSNVTITSGDSTTLTATGGTAYLWSTSATNASISVKPTTTTTYYVTVTNATGCTATSSVKVTVGAVSCSVNAGIDKTICNGASASLTATGATSYSWSTGGKTATINVSPTTTTTYIVTGTTGACTATDAVVVTVRPVLNITAYAWDSILCAGESTYLQAEGASSYSWSTNQSGSIVLINPTITTTYRVTGSDAMGCTNTNSVIVNVSIVNANAGSDVTITSGDSTTLTATGGATYLWSTNATNASISVKPTITTTYYVTVTSVAGCTATSSVKVTVSTAPCYVSAGVDKTICTGDAVILTATGATSYSWSTGGKTATINVSPTTTTTYIVTGTTGACTATDAVVVNVIVKPTINVSPTFADVCYGDSIMLTATGATTYIWSNGQSTSTINVSPTITTTYTVTGVNNGCSNTISKVVTVNPLPTANAGSDVTITLGQATTLTATGGLYYFWTNNDTSASITVNPSITTTYGVTVTNAEGCSATDFVIVSVVEQQNCMVNAGSDVTICQGDSVSLAATGTDNYLWSNGSTTSNIIVKPTVTTSYIVTGTIEECTATDMIIVTISPIPNVNLNASLNPICIGSTIILTATGASSYTWSNGATSSYISVSPVSTTTYTVTGLNSFGCYNIATTTITVNPLPIVNAGKDVTINVGETIELSATGGIIYSWSTGEETQQISVSPTVTTTYIVTVNDNNYCYSTDNVVVFVNEVSELSIDRIYSYRASCYEGSDGKAIIIVSGGVPPYTFHWSNGMNNDTISGLARGEYTVTVTDMENNSIIGKTPISSPNYLAMPICTTLNITNNSATLSWSAVNGATTYMIRYREKEIGTWRYINVSFSQTSIAVSYLELNTTYEWQIRALKDNQTYSCFTEYIEFTTSETSTCITPKDIATTNITTFSATMQWDYDSTASRYLLRYKEKGQSNIYYRYFHVDGSLNFFTVFGLQLNKTYEWQIRKFCVNAFYSDFTGLEEFSTSTNCSTPDNLISERITRTSAILKWTKTDGALYTLLRYREEGGDWRYINLSRNIVQVGCMICGEKDMLKPNTKYEWQIRAFCSGDGTIYSDFTEINSFTTAGLTANAGEDRTICYGAETTLGVNGIGTYIWSTGETTPTIKVSPLINTTYSLSVTLNGVSSTDDVIVSVNPKVEIFAGNDTTICSGQELLLQASGAENYEWNTGSLKDNITVNPLYTQQYIVTGINNGCLGYDTININVIQSPYTNVYADKNNICEGESVNIYATGGNEFIWNNGDTIAIINVNPATSATFIVTTTANGCSSSAEVFINVMNTFANAGIDKTICKGEYAYLTATGGAQYKWSNNFNSQSINVNPETNIVYYVTVTSSTGCTSIDSVAVNVTPDIIVNIGNDTAICAGTKITLTANADNPTAFRWSTGSLRQTISVIPSVSTSYRVTVYSGTCSGVGSINVNIIQCKNNEENLLSKGSISDINIYPNPNTNGLVNISFEGLDENEKVNIKVVNYLGQSVIKEDISYNNTRFVHQLKLNNCQSGIYYLIINYNNQQETYKLIVE